jgi:uncharacterized protein DUF993
VQIKLPNLDRQLITYRLRHEAPRSLIRGPAPRSRIVYAAAHVVCDPLADRSPVDSPCLDWEATLGFRHHLWSLGLRIAEAMDTAQRGSGLDWEASKELIRRSLNESRAVSGGIACGAGTEQLLATGATLQSVQSAYEEQCEFVEAQGGQIIMMASRALAACARGPDDYRAIYGRILRQTSQPVILHWLGEAFDPSLTGYWGAPNIPEAMDVCLGIIHEHQSKIDGIKISLLDRQYEIAMRRRLPSGVHMYTGDDFHYDELIAGDEEGYSNALLGVFDPLAEFAAQCVRLLDAGDLCGFREMLQPTVPFSRHLFQKPTFFYKTGVVFLAYLNGHQKHFRMVGGQEGFRSIVHLAELFRLADQIGLFLNPELAVKRMGSVLALAGVEQ